MSVAWISEGYVVGVRCERIERVTFPSQQPLSWTTESGVMVGTARIQARAI